MIPDRPAERMAGSDDADFCTGKAGFCGVPEELKKGYGMPNRTSGFFPGLMKPSSRVSRPVGFSKV